MPDDENHVNKQVIAGNIVLDETDLTGNTPLGTQFDITNSLITRNITVAKSWDDNSYPDAASLHYKVEVTLKCDDLLVGTSKQPYSVAKIISEADGHGVVYAGLPVYNASGALLSYSVEEKPAAAGASADSTDAANLYNVTGAEDSAVTVTDKKYGYEGSCKVNKDSSSGNAVVRFNILNKLPLTSVKVIKHWDDQSDKYGIRPHAPDASNADPLGLTLESRTGSNSWSVPSYSMKQTYPAASGNTWIYIYQKLLKYDEENTAYEFRITESLDGSATHLGGYTDPTYTTRTLSGNDLKTLSSGSTWDGMTELNKPLELTNSLDTRNIIVSKQWKDNGNTGYRYNLAITLSNNKTTNRETKYLASDATQGLLFEGLPKYYSDGSVITYNINLNP